MIKEGQFILVDDEEFYVEYVITTINETGIVYTVKMVHTITGGVLYVELERANGEYTYR